MLDRETLEELVENDLIEDLTEVYKSCASDKIKEMYESYGEELWHLGLLTENCMHFRRLPLMMGRSFMAET